MGEVVTGLHEFVQPMRRQKKNLLLFDGLFDAATGPELDAVFVFDPSYVQFLTNRRCREGRYRIKYALALSLTHRDDLACLEDSFQRKLRGFGQTARSGHTITA